MTALQRSDLPGVLAAVLLVNVVGAAPAAPGGPDSAWFASLTGPAIFPPTWLFGVARTTTFFGAQNLPLALGVILALFVTATATAAMFQRVDRVAGALFVPYRFMAVN